MATQQRSDFEQTANCLPVPRLQRRVLGVILLGASTSLTFAADATSHALNFNIAPQSVESALLEFSNQADVQVMVGSTAVAGQHTRGVKGQLSVPTALSQLLRYTNLTYETVGNTVTVKRVAAATRAEPRKIPPEQTRSRGGDDSAALQMRVPSPSTTSDPRRSGSRMEEIIVTARKRTENVQDVPISISVVRSDEIDRRGLVNAEDYLRGIPGANQVDSPYGQSIVIRGIETSLQSQNFFSGTTVATYFGETPTTTSAGLTGGTNVDLKLVDIERVEVLRGPQGTAFGNASMGGAVRTIPVAPKLEDTEGKVVAGYSATSGTGGDSYTVQAVGNLPLITGKLAIRGTAYKYEDSGFYRNRAGSDLDFRAAAVTPYGAEASAIDQAEAGSYYVVGGRIATLFKASDDLRLTLSYLRQKTQRDGIALANSGTYEQTLLQVAPEHVVRGQTGGVFDTDIGIANVVMEYDFGLADLVATYSYIKSESEQAIPLGSYGVNWPASYHGFSPHRGHVGEIRVATRFEGAWNFLAGAYAEELRDELSSDYFWHGDPATNFLGAERLIAVNIDKRKLKQIAAFGEASWEFLPRLTFTGGVRAFEYDRTFRNDANGAFYGPDGIHVSKDTKASDANFRANLSYKVDNGALFYAGWSEGFRLGHLQPGLPAGTCDVNGDGIADGTNIAIESTRNVNSDDVDSYELGGKFALLDRRLIVAADVFRMNWSGMPITVSPRSLSGGSEGCVFGWLANAGAARSEGIEFQANVQIAEPLRIDFGGSWIHARLTKNVPALNASEGDTLPGSPEFNANLSAQYEFVIGGNKAAIRADSIYVGPFDGDLSHTPDRKSGDYVKLDASARLEIGNFNIDLFVRNVTNEDAFTFRGSGSAGIGEFYGYRLRPRTIGFQLGYTF
jgi:iron complex outermembrane recepter protein